MKMRTLLFWGTLCFAASCALAAPGTNPAPQFRTNWVSGDFRKVGGRWENAALAPGWKLVTLPVGAVCQKAHSEGRIEPITLGVTLPASREYWTLLNFPDGPRDSAMSRDGIAGPQLRLTRAIGFRLKLVNCKTNFALAGQITGITTTWERLAVQGGMAGRFSNTTSVRYLAKHVASFKIRPILNGEIVGVVVSHGV